MENVIVLEDRIQEISCIADQIGSIAVCAANVGFKPDECERILDDVLYGIKHLSDQISNELNNLTIDVLRDKGLIL